MELLYEASGERFKTSDFQDELTGHWIRRLTPDGINISPYFNSYAWTSDGKWVFFLRITGGEAWVAALEVDTGLCRKIAGPFPAPGQIPQDGDIQWGTLNAIPGTNAATYVADNAVWRVELNGEACKLADLPYPYAFHGNSDVSGDGRWHAMALTLLSAEGWERRAEIAWPPDPFYEQYVERTVFLRVALDGSGQVETMFELPKFASSHVSINPQDPDLIMYSDQSAHGFRWRRIWLRRVGEADARPLRDQRSGKVWVTHERWYPDGKRFAYHGHYQQNEQDWPPVSYAGWYDMERELPFEFIIEGERCAYSHVLPSPDGQRLFMEMLPCEKVAPQRLYELMLDRERGTCRRTEVTAVTSDLSPLPNDQWRSIDPVFSPDGKRILFRAAHEGEVHMYVVDI